MKKALPILCGVILTALLASFLCIHFFARKSDVLRVLITKADYENDALHRAEMPIDRERALLHSFAEEQKLKVEFIPVPSFLELFRYLNEGKGDLISANLSETKLRKEEFLLSEPFEYTKEVVFTSSRLTAQGSPAQLLAGKTGVLLPDTTYIANFSVFAAGTPGVRYRILPHTLSHDKLIELVADKYFDYSVLNECDLDAWLSAHKGIRKLFPVRDRVPLVFAARKKSRALINKLNNFIVRQRAFLQPETPSQPQPPVQEPAVVPLAVKEPKVSKPAVVPPAVKEPKVSKPAVVPPAVKEPKVSKPAIVPPAVKEPKVAQVPQPVSKKEIKAVSVPPKKRAPASPHCYSFDLNRIKKRGYIRVLTLNDAFCCYLKQGQLCGFEYELAKRFADSLGVKLLTIIPSGYSDLFRYLEEGQGDFIAANLTLIPERVKAYPNFVFGPPYHGAVEMLAGRLGEKITSTADLKNRKIHVAKGSSYYWTLRKLQAQGIKFTLVEIPEHETALIVLHKVAAGKYDLCVVDDNFLNFAIAGNCKVKPLFPLTQKTPFAWVVRKNNPELAAAVRKFFKKENKSTFFNLCLRRNYSLKTARKLVPKNINNFELSFSPYDALFRKYGKKYDILWYALAAQSYQESRFIPDQVNHIGATGLMQITPRTAQELGIKNLKNPENGIHAGTKYLAKLRDRFPENLDMQNKLCFALASYNAGYGHVRDARILAAKLGLNPNIWFFHTEKALALLEDPRYAAKAKYGYCRASETVPYVRNIALQCFHYYELQKSFEEKKKNNKTPRPPKEQKGKKEQK